jgi:hypothetical protein
MTDLSSYEPIDRWARSAHPERRCTAHRKNGDQCKNAARHGANVCDFHGAKAPQVKRKARQRIEEAADRMACELLKMATDANVADSVKLAAIRDALDRAGLATRTAVEVEVGPPKPYEQIMSGMTEVVGGSRAEFRRSQGIFGGEESPPNGSSRPELAAPIDAEVVDQPHEARAIATNRRTIRRRST